jgi:hypothetical protein
MFIKYFGFLIFIILLVSRFLPTTISEIVFNLCCLSVILVALYNVIIRKVDIMINIVIIIFVILFFFIEYYNLINYFKLNFF